jgi:hypothetical protein
VHIRGQVADATLLHTFICLPYFGEKLLESLGGLNLFLELPQHKRMGALPRPLGETSNTVFQSLG